MPWYSKLMEDLHLTVYCQYQNNPIINNIKFFLRPFLPDEIKSVSLVYRSKDDEFLYKTLRMNAEVLKDSIPNYHITVYEAPAGKIIVFYFLVTLLDGTDQIVDHLGKSIEYTILKSNTTTLRMDIQARRTN